ncbi:unnamed protein product [Paramecium sonneborni]|uniref:COMM domain-containing protein n=1 Tax=Paramecium sonneborni TaxID=65129 RepID=A0A8S1QKM7_9CILI|nr:unnamed protein product [Paramecium sonneborni]
MEYLTNEKLLKQQQSVLFSINNSRSNSVSRFPIPSQRAINDPVQPLKSADLFNKLEDILKQKQLNTTTRKKQKQISCIINPQACNEEKKYNIEASYYKSPIRLLDVSTNGCFDNNIQLRNRRQTLIIGSPPVNQQNQSSKIEKNNIQNQFQESQNQKKKESLKRFQDEFNNMQEKIRGRNNSILQEDDRIQIKEKKIDLNISTAKENKSITLNKLNYQLQIQNNHLQEQLLFEQNQNSKLNMLINNLNDQITALNKQINQQQQSINDDSQIKEKTIKQQNSKIEQLQLELKQKDQDIQHFKQQISEFQNVYKEMQELENLCSSMSFIGKQSLQHNHLIHEIQDLLQVQNNIIEKVTSNRDFQIEQLIIQKKQKKQNLQEQVDYQELCQETTRIQENIIKQIKNSVEQLTERFIHDLLI